MEAGLGDLPGGLFAQQPALPEHDLGFPVVEAGFAQSPRIGDEGFVAVMKTDLGVVVICGDVLPARLIGLTAVTTCDEQQLGDPLGQVGDRLPVAGVDGAAGVL